MSVVLIVAGQPTPLPNTPTLLLPENGSYEDLSGTPSFEWTYNAGDPSSGTTQTNYLFALIVNGGVTLYWNASEESFQSSQVWNTGTTTVADQTFTLTFPSGAFTDGDNYMWAVASEDVNGQGPLSGYFTVTAESLPTVTVTAPTGTITSSDPIVSWSVEFPTGASQIAYRMAIYDAATYNQPGFEPGGTVSPDPNAVYDTGVVGSASGTSVNLESLAVYLPNNTQYRAYVQVTETGSLASDWAYSPFTVAYTPPNTPTISISQTTDPNTGYPVIEIVVQGNDNLLSADDADPTLGIGTWTAVENCTVASSSSGLQITGAYTPPPGTVDGGSASTTASETVDGGSASTTASETLDGGFASEGSDAEAETATGTAGYVVEADTEYTAVASFRATTTGRTCSVGIAWYNSVGEQIGDTVFGDTITDNTVSPTQASVTATSPSQAAYATIVLTVESIVDNEVHDVTEIALLLGSSTTWGPGGFVGLQDLVLLRSDGLYVRGASIVNPAVLDASTQQLEASTWGEAGYIDDYECVQHTEYTYQAQVIVTLSPNNSVLSTPATSNEVDFVVTISGGSFQSAWWTIDPTNPSSAANATISSYQPSSTRQATAHPVTGMTTMNIVADTQLNQDFTGTYETFADSVYNDLESLITAGATVFVSSPWGANASGYFSIGPAPGGLSSGTGVMTKDATLNPSVYGAGYYSINVTAIAQNRPSV